MGKGRQKGVASAFAATDAQPGESAWPAAQEKNTTSVSSGSVKKKKGEKDRPSTHTSAEPRTRFRVARAQHGQTVKHADEREGKGWEEEEDTGRVKQRSREKKEKKCFAVPASG